MRPLAGIKILDLTTVAMGPLASQWLGDFGADVIKIEAPCGDSTRHTGPAVEADMASLYLGANRNKRSVVLDLKRDAARSALLKMVDTADVFMHNVRPQKLEKLGLGPTALQERNPRLVYAGLHGFGESGPYGGRPAYDDVIQGLAGCADLMMRQTGEPRYFPAIVADKTTGLIATMAILAALNGRHRTGKGSYIEIPMFESMSAFNLQEHLYGCHFDPPRASVGYPRALSLHRRPWKTLDGFVCMLPYTDAHWRAFFEEADSPQHWQDARFSSIAARTRHIDELYAIAAGIVATRNTHDWLSMCDRAHIPAAQVSSLEALLADPHLAAVGFFQWIEDPVMGRVRFTGVPVLFDGERPSITFPPRLGEHTRQVLAEAGVSRDHIEAITSEREL
jgi:crotonobetainyl-CoA:carnitine CoA-transferase CaiB-like acyl-CoA transferase